MNFPLLKTIKIIHSKSFDMIGNNSPRSTGSRTVCFSAPYCSWETRRGNLDHHRSVSCPRAGRMLLFLLREIGREENIWK